MPDQTHYLKLFNTETRTKERVTPAKEGEKIRIYTCGPTVYSYAHIGNFRTYIFEDLLLRTLHFFGFPTHHVMNITDVDDKTIRGAIRDGLTLAEYTAPFTKAFFEDLDTLKIGRADHYPAATDYIPQMIEMIQELLDKGLAYVGEDKSVYYSIQKFPSYGRLSHLQLESLQAGASERVASDEYEKEYCGDFVIWKGYDPERDGEIFWESPFGRGRPGWHMECSAMAVALLGETIDLHCGGVDNIFPHHENEIAQSEGCTGHTFSRMWCHSEHLIVEGKKMAKSAGNFFTLRDLLQKGFTGRQVRYMLLHTHYRQQLNFTAEGLEGAAAALARLDNFVERVQEVEGGHRVSEHLPHKSGIEREVVAAHHKFAEALADDLNISAALAVLFDFIREINGRIDLGQVSDEEREEVIGFLREVDQVLGLLKFGDGEEVPPEVVQLAVARQEARQQREWKRADELRQALTERGYAVEDRPDGFKLRKI